MSSANILFYSNHCECSKHLISSMQNENLIRFFHTICVDNNPKIPPQITKTPTLIIRSIPTPYVAGDAFVWLSRIKQWKVNATMQKVTSAQQQYLQSVNNNLVANDSKVLGFSQAEMNGMSDIFSFFSQDDAFPQSYVTCDSMHKETIFTPPLEDGKINVTEQKKKQNQLVLDRKKQDETFKKLVKDFKDQYVEKN